VTAKVTGHAAPLPVLIGGCSAALGFGVHTLVCAMDRHDRVLELIVADRRGCRSASCAGSWRGSASRHIGHRSPRRTTRSGRRRTRAGAFLTLLSMLLATAYILVKYA
jgi:hypothetical protein